MGSLPPRPSGGRAAYPLAILLGAPPGPPPPRALRACSASVVSELASHEVLGFGASALPSALGVETLGASYAIATDRDVPASSRRVRTHSSPATAPPAGKPDAETRPSLPSLAHTKARESPEP